MLKEIIDEKDGNIGSLCIYLDKRKELLKELNDNINFIDYNKLTLPQKIYIYKKNYNNIFCNCGKLKKWKSYKDGWRKTCGDKNCIIKKRKTTNIKKYNVDNPLKSKEIRDKSRKTMLFKYGKEYPIQVKEFKEKRVKTLKDNYGVDHQLKSDIIKNKIKEKWKNKTFLEKEELKNKKKSIWDNISDVEKMKIDNKRKKTNLKKYGNLYSINSDEIKEKIKKQLKIKYNVESPFDNKEIRQKASLSYKNNKVNELKDKLSNKYCEYINHENINNSINYILKCTRKNKIFKISYTNLRSRLDSNLDISPFFYKKKGISEIETEIFNFIDDNHNKQIIKNSKKIINPYELDIYIPDLKLAFEFNGLYWHSEIYKDKNYHLNKTELCEKEGIQLIHIWEDDWIYKQDIVKSMILNKLGKIPNKIYAKKSNIKEITDNKLVSNFLKRNHIKGFLGSKIKLGLFYNEEMVSLMTISKNGDNYNILRFCDKLNINVINSGNKLFSYFVDKYNPKKVNINLDRSWNNGNVFHRLGFRYDMKLPPNYYYIVDGVKRYGYNFRKYKLVKEGYDPELTEHQIMLNRKIYRIYDSGILKLSFIDYMN